MSAVTWVCGVGASMAGRGMHAKWWPWWKKRGKILGAAVGSVVVGVEGWGWRLRRRGKWLFASLQDGIFIIRSCGECQGKRPVVRVWDMQARRGVCRRGWWGRVSVCMAEGDVEGGGVRGEGGRAVCSEWRGGDGGDGWRVLAYGGAGNDITCVSCLAWGGEACIGGVSAWRVSGQVLLPPWTEGGERKEGEDTRGVTWGPIPRLGEVGGQMRSVGNHSFPR